MPFSLQRSFPRIHRSTVFNSRCTMARTDLFFATHSVFGTSRVVICLPACSSAKFSIERPALSCWRNRASTFTCSEHNTTHSLSKPLRVIAIKMLDMQIWENVDTYTHIREASEKLPRIFHHLTSNGSESMRECLEKLY